ncbi:hypothetical protein CDAR_69401 [Caerostris darwini]|uniref:Uncharacterized protein n=1 Tax=Caerostris darwini TaxID=1538125 RepID=A0AAV4U0P8_9ARAC|nr:hypothetical protein CDAR_69401 [Caerostris darwini]
MPNRLENTDSEIVRWKQRYSRKGYAVGRQQPSKALENSLREWHLLSLVNSRNLARLARRYTESEKSIITTASLQQRKSTASATRIGYYNKAEPPLQLPAHKELSVPTKECLV